jgi:hypothetical protein
MCGVQAEGCSLHPEPSNEGLFIVLGKSRVRNTFELQGSVLRRVSGRRSDSFCSAGDACSVLSCFSLQFESEEDRR